MKLTFHDLIEDLNFHKKINRNHYNCAEKHYTKKTLESRIETVFRQNISLPYRKFIDDPIVLKKKYYTNSKISFIVECGHRFYFNLACKFFVFLIFCMKSFFSSIMIYYFIRKFKVFKPRYLNIFFNRIFCFENYIKLIGSEKYFEPKVKIYSPNLTLYTPLHSALISVSIRFMGLILLLLFIFILNIFLLLYIYNISSAFMIFIFTFILGLIFLTFFIHVSFSMYHIISKLTKLKFPNTKIDGPLMRKLDETAGVIFNFIEAAVEKYYKIKFFLKNYRKKIFGITLILYDDEIPKPATGSQIMVIEQNWEYYVYYDISDYFYDDYHEKYPNGPSDYDSDGYEDYDDRILKIEREDEEEITLK